MCGLLTFVSAHGIAGVHRDSIADALENLHHRGPDDTGVETFGDSPGGDVVCGFKRLAFIDVAHSHQPLRYLDRYLLTFNGEIYNYIELRDQLRRECNARFETDGDGEVILAAYHHWGLETALRRLRGMFSFVIWDKVERRAVGARDPFGIKPLFYLLTNDGLYLTSEKKALMPFAPSARAGNNGIDHANLSHYLTLQYVPEPSTMHRGIHRVECGQAFTYRPGEPVQLSRYYRADFRPSPVSDEQALYKKIEDTLRESVRLHMRSEVPLGCLLSSGIDSTAVVALAREFNPKVKTFTVGYDVPGYSEIDVAADSAQHLGVELIPTKIGPQDMMEQLPRIVWHLDDPVADPALVPLYFVNRTAAQHVTAVLSGEGADEFFGGYTIYREPLSLRSVAAMPDGIKRGLRSVANVMPEGVKGKSFIDRGTVPLEERYYGNARIFSEAEKKTLMRYYDPRVQYTDVTAPLYAECAHLDEVTRMQYIDLYTWLRGDILVKADRMSMAHSLEVRVPFLDPVVFELAATIPTELKVTLRGNHTKYALRQAVRNIVPPPIVNRRKWGFPTPTRVWLKNDMYEWAAMILAQSAAGELIDLPYVRKLLDAHRKGEADNSRKVWTVLVFCVWHAIFVERSIDPRPKPAESALLTKPVVHRVTR
ncbi:asparagine synthase (glutamine-hydrolyzing) [Actinocatenispora rupis]|uniref:asparagine synthase (glutamine-hydrolyzing) n=1 Tax=Actinocatenispora rupis TaxID=519421 RepID=A0A8J3J2I0_9ACTN|nr:asparagine synthase (glutamine-hydrolyzing) [Actinocatenispora rupis]GID12983.1 putative asparagine synthetase [glutamine-hydrolyzing] [Actinocatenispora rupis]